MKPASPHDRAEAGARIVDGKYRLERSLGEGAVGTVYRATHLGLKKAFALKLLKPGPALDPFAVSRFQREAEALGQLGHPNIVAVTDSGLDPETGAPYLVMELLDGVPLAQLCQAAGPLPLYRALPILEAIAAAVDAAHQRGILHRDLKPGNVLLCGADENHQVVKVLDFGLAEIFAPPFAETGDRRAPGNDATADARVVAAERLTSTGDLLGTPLYVAPEVIRQARPSPASDVYSFGVIAFELLAGRPPFQGPMAEVLAGHLEKEPSPPAGALPVEVCSVLREPLAKDPALRPATAREVVRRLRAAAGRDERARWRRNEVPRRVLLSATLAAAVALAGLLPPGAGLPALERWAYDLRVRLAPARSPDPRILLVTLDEPSLAGSKALAERADEIGSTLDRIFAAGARGMALDLLLPDPWSASRGFSDFVLRRSPALTLAAFSSPNGSVLGTGCVAGLTAAAMGPERSAALFGFVNLDEDTDGVIRRGRLGFRDRSGGQRPSWAAKAAATISSRPATTASPRFWIDHRIDGARYARISWRDVPAALAKRPWLFRDRLVLVGGDVVAAGDDVQRVPRRSGREEMVSGLTLQALLVDAIAGGLPVREAPRLPFVLGACVWTGLAAAAVLLARRLSWGLAGFVLGLLLYLAASVPVFQRTGLLLPVTGPLLPVLGALLIAVALRQVLPPLPSSPS